MGMMDLLRVIPDVGATGVVSGDKGEAIAGQILYE